MDFDPSPCPACESLDLEVLKRTPAAVTLRCNECGEVHSASPRKLRTREVAVIVSEGAESWRTRMDVVTTDTIEVGAEFDLEGRRMLVTGVEGHGEARADRMVGTDVHTIHAKAFDHVALKVSINDGDVTHSFVLMVEPDEPIHIGQVLEVEGRRGLVKTLKSDENRTVRKGGLMARHIRRVFCDPAERPRKTVRRAPQPPPRRSQWAPGKGPRKPSGHRGGTKHP